MFNRKLKEENRRLRKRIEQMEIKICNGNHKWVEVGSRCDYNGVDVDIIYSHVCSECGKEKVDRR